MPPFQELRTLRESRVIRPLHVMCASPSVFISTLRCACRSFARLGHPTGVYSEISTVDDLVWMELVSRLAGRVRYGVGCCMKSGAPGGRYQSADATAMDCPREKEGC